MLYLFSDFLYVLFFYIFKYRKRVVLKNLELCFPEKSHEEIKKIARLFYKHLCDIIVEGIKGYSISKKTIVKRHKIVNPEVLNTYFNEGKSVVAVTAHYSNWEWGSVSGPLQLKHNCLAFYKPIKNKYIDGFINSSRRKSGLELVSINNTSEAFEKNMDKPSVFLMVADQSPYNIKTSFWIDFFNVSTPWLHGPEKHAKRNNLPIVYLDIYRKKRGYYETKIHTLDVKEYESHGAITHAYVKFLERIIKEKPQWWLWSHKRWKHVFIDLYKK